MKRALTILALLGLSACPLPGEAWGPCADLECIEGFICHGQYAGDPSNVITMCIPLNPSNNPDDCPDAFILGQSLDSHGVSTCRVPCEDDDDCIPEAGLVCGVIGSCGWEE